MGCVQFAMVYAQDVDMLFPSFQNLGNLKTWRLAEGIHSGRDIPRLLSVRICSLPLRSAADWRGAARRVNTCHRGTVPVDFCK